jgi:hypothetical protein
MFPFTANVMNDIPFIYFIFWMIGEQATTTILPPLNLVHSFFLLLIMKLLAIGCEKNTQSIFISSEKKVMFPYMLECNVSSYAFKLVHLYSHAIN